MEFSQSMKFFPMNVVAFFLSACVNEIGIATPNPKSRTTQNPVAHATRTQCRLSLITSESEGVGED